TLMGVCMSCHGTQTRMAAVPRDENGWRRTVDYMRRDMNHLLRDQITDSVAADLASYMNQMFGRNSVLPKSPADLPEYAKVRRPQFSDEAMKIVYVDFEMPGASRFPWSGYPDNAGHIWMPYYNGNAKSLGRLDPQTGEVQEWRLPGATHNIIHSAVPA